MEIQEFLSKKDEFIQNAIELGKQTTKGSIILRTDIDALEDLDKVIDEVHNLYSKKLIDDTVAWNVSVVLGTLLGEIIIKENGFHWAINNIPVVETEEKNQLSPISKINKIILDQDNIEGSAKGFYDGFIALSKYYSMSDEEKEKITQKI
ncbi:MAG: hypothetical protein IKW90_10395 [Lachnospiraceae bacterium]|nr:hypothetical protein [Lachnospiraceae bacterium]